ncbi:MAG: right-handed parallel beta-helix repeat-containing protein [Acidobacteriota bacterium]
MSPRSCRRALEPSSPRQRSATPLRWATLLPLALFCVLAFGLAGAAEAAILRVPQDVGNLQTALDQVGDGDVILVANGVYSAPGGGFRIRNAGKSFTVRADGGSVILDGGNSTNVLRLENNNLAQGKRVFFEGLTFRNGITNEVARAGGVTVDTAEASFVDCRFENNRSVGLVTGGGGVRVVNGSVAVFTGCEWENNTSPLRGGGIEVLFSQVHVIDSEFESNRVNLPGHRNDAVGGGIYAQDSNVRVWDSTFRNNQAAWVGGALYTIGVWREPLEDPPMDASVVGSVFENNIAEPSAGIVPPGKTGGGAIHAEDHATLRVDHSRFDNNEGERGGAINGYRAILEISDSVLRGNLATDTASPTGGGIYLTAADFVDSSTDFGSINRRSGSLLLEDSLVQGAFGGVDIAAGSGGCLSLIGDTNRRDGVGGVAPEGTDAENRVNAVVDGTVFYRCNIERSSGSILGGAVSANFADFTLSDSLVLDSEARGSGAAGGGVAVLGNSRAVVEQSTFSNNRAERFGAGLWVNTSNIQVVNSLFLANEISPGVSETVGESRGAAIFTIPQSDDVTGVVRGSTFIDNIGVPIFDNEPPSGPVNRVQYDSNRFGPASFGNTVYVHIQDNRQGTTAAGLNALVIQRPGGDNTDKSPGGSNQQLTSDPRVGHLLTVPSAVRAPKAGDPVAPTFLAWATGGSGTTTLTGPAGAPGTVSALGDIDAITNAGGYSLRVGGQQVDSFAPNALVCSGGPMLCVEDDRWRLEVEWEDFQGNTGVGTSVPLTDDTGYFFFFLNPNNVELVVKVLDARVINNHHWVFYGALSNVEYTLRVLDQETARLREFFNPSRNFASVGDTNAFLNRPPGRGDDSVTSSPQELADLATSFEADGVRLEDLPENAFLLPLVLEEQEKSLDGVPPKNDCVPNSTTLCLRQQRFAVTMDFTDFQGNSDRGQAVSLTSDTGYFFFRNPNNVEVVLKVLDGRPINGFFWVFYGALSNVEYTLTVTDTETGNEATFFNPLRTFGSDADVQALPGGN